MNNYRANYKKIRNYAKAIGIKIKWDDNVDGSAVYESGKITIDRKFRDKNIAIWTLLHELGHAMHSCMEPKQYESVRYDFALDRMDADKPLTKGQKKLVLRNEKKAWEYGRVIARQLNIKLGAAFDLDEERSLKTYQEYK